MGAVMMPDDDAPSLWTLPKVLPPMWYKEVRDEWSSRTRFGKLLFPCWLLWSAFRWVVVLAVLAVLAMYKHLLDAGHDPDAYLDRTLPRTHKDESGTQSSDGQPPEEPVDDAIELLETPKGEYDEDLADEGRELLGFLSRSVSDRQGEPMPGTDPEVSKDTAEDLSWGWDPLAASSQFPGDR